MASLRNNASSTLTDLPITVGIHTHGSHPVYLNRSANLDYFDSHVAAIAPHAVTTWVFTTRGRVPTGRAFATVGISALHPAAGAHLPQIDVSTRAGRSGPGERCRVGVEPFGGPSVRPPGIRGRGSRRPRCGRRTRGRDTSRNAGDDDREHHSAGQKPRGHVAADRTTDDLQLGAESMSVTDSEQTLEAPAVTEPSIEYETCEQCQAPVDVHQRYCVECGAHRRHVYDPAARFLSDATGRSRAAARSARGPVGPKRRAPGWPSRSCSPRFRSRSPPACSSVIAETTRTASCWPRSARRSPTVVNVAGGGTASGASTASTTGSRRGDAGGPADQQLRAAAGLRGRAADAPGLRDHRGASHRGRTTRSSARRQRGRVDRAKRTTRSLRSPRQGTTSSIRASTTRARTPPLRWPS